MHKSNNGVSLVEVLIVITILLLLIGIYFSFRGQLEKGRDAKRKEDLERIRVAFEDYFNDNGCYPDVSILENCGSDALKPYLSEVPCDPVTEQPYKAVAGRFTESGCYQWYKVYAFLENTSDAAIGRLGLSGDHSIEGEPVNYGVSSPNVAVGSVPATTFLCPTTGEPAPNATTCGNPDSYLGRCGIGICSCLEDQRIFQSPRGYYYCCPDETCP